METDLSVEMRDLSGRAVEKGNLNIESFQPEILNVFIFLLIFKYEALELQNPTVLRKYN